MYDVYLERAAERDLNRLQSFEFERIIIAIRKLKENPRPQGCRKITGSKSDWRIRAGDYRIIYEIDDKGRVIKIFRIRNRKEVYRK